MSEGREVLDWLLIFDLTTEDVFGVIRDAGQSPHWIYSHGVSRRSCSFCIFGSKSDLRRAAELRPDLIPRFRRPGAAHRPHAMALAPNPPGDHGRTDGGSCRPERRRPRTLAVQPVASHNRGKPARRPPPACRAGPIHLEPHLPVLTF